MYEAYIFDLYGTLVDIRTNESKPFLWKKMSEIYSSLGACYTPTELKKAFRRLEAEETERRQKELGQTYAEPELRHVFQALFREKQVDCDVERARLMGITFRTLSRQKLKVYDGVKETLQKLRNRGRKIYLLSNAQTDFTRPELQILGLTPCFDGIFISSEEGVKKPSPEFFQRLLTRYDLKAENCLMVGNDETSDIAGAESAGMDSLYIQTETSPKLKAPSRATYCVPDGDWKKVTAILLEEEREKMTAFLPGEDREKGGTL